VEIHKSMLKLSLLTHLTLQCCDQAVNAVICNTNTHMLRGQYNVKASVTHVVSALNNHVCNVLIFIGMDRACVLHLKWLCT
jgi:hypothetical protein